MADPTYPLMKGKAVDFSSLDLSWKAADGTSIPPLQGYVSLDWENARSGKHVWGKSAKPIRQTRGRLTPSATLKLLKEEWKYIKGLLGNGYLENPFDITGTWLEDNFESTIEILGTTINKESESTTEDGEPAITLELLPMDVIEDGITPLNE